MHACVGAWSLLGVIKDADIRAALREEVTGGAEDVTDSLPFPFVSITLYAAFDLYYVVWHHHVMPIYISL